MEQLILQPTVTAQWHALINEAEVASSVLLEEDMESYLVFLLMRYTERPEIAADIMGLDFLNGLHATGGERLNTLRDVGDKCLLFSSYYPELAKRRNVSEAYYIDMGQSAYSLAAENYERTAELYKKLSDKFENLSDVLKITKVLSNNTLKN